MLLDDTDRAKFLRYCESEAYSYKALAEQTDKLGLAFVTVSKIYLANAAAFAHVARLLRETESFSVGGSKT